MPKKRRSGYDPDEALRSLERKLKRAQNRRKKRVKAAETKKAEREAAAKKRADAEAARGKPILRKKAEKAKKAKKKKAGRKKAPKKMGGRRPAKSKARGRTARKPKMPKKHSPKNKPRSKLQAVTSPALSSAQIKSLVNRIKAVMGDAKYVLVADLNLDAMELFVLEPFFSTKKVDGERQPALWLGGLGKFLQKIGGAEACLYGLEKPERKRPGTSAGMGMSPAELAAFDREDDDVFDTRDRGDPGGPYGDAEHLPRGDRSSRGKHPRRAAAGAEYGRQKRVRIKKIRDTPGVTTRGLLNLDRFLAKKKREEKGKKKDESTIAAMIGNVTKPIAVVKRYGPWLKDQLKLLGADD